MSPSVGTWSPRVGLGAPLAPGLVLGVLRRAGSPLEVVAPPGTGGVVVEVAGPGVWLCFGEALLTLGEGAVAAATSVASAPSDPDAPPAGVVAVRAETDGTIYLRPDPAAAAYVDEGADVAAHAPLALVEVMKTFNPVRSPAAGTVERVVVEDGAGVVQGQVLFWLRTA